MQRFERFVFDRPEAHAEIVSYLLQHGYLNTGAKIVGSARTDWFALSEEAPENETLVVKYNQAPTVYLDITFDTRDTSGKELVALTALNASGLFGQSYKPQDDADLRMSLKKPQDLPALQRILTNLGYLPDKNIPIRSSDYYECLQSWKRPEQWDKVYGVVLTVNGVPPISVTVPEQEKTVVEWLLQQAGVAQPIFPYVKRPLVTITN
jgi:hypothetical protein